MNMVEDSCWICLQDGGTLHYPCKCPRQVHSRCLASWQLYRAGTREETECRFCATKLLDWRSSLCPKAETVITPIVAVVYEGQEYRFSVEPTPEGQKKFTRDVEALIGHSLDLHEVRFHCRGPTGNHLQLRGLQSLDAAVHCAAATAAERSAQLESLISASTAADYNLLWQGISEPPSSRQQAPAANDSSSRHQDGVNITSTVHSSNAHHSSNHATTDQHQQQRPERTGQYPAPVYTSAPSNNSTRSSPFNPQSAHNTVNTTGSILGSNALRLRQATSPTATPTHTESSVGPASTPQAAATTVDPRAPATAVSTEAVRRPIVPVLAHSSWSEHLQQAAAGSRYNFLPGAIVELRDPEGNVQPHGGSSCVFGWLCGLLRALLNH